MGKNYIESTRNEIFTAFSLWITSACVLTFDHFRRLSATLYGVDSWSFGGSVISRKRKLQGWCSLRNSWLSGPQELVLFHSLPLLSSKKLPAAQGLPWKATQIWGLALSLAGGHVLCLWTWHERELHLCTQQKGKAISKINLPHRYQNQEERMQRVVA